MSCLQSRQIKLTGLKLDDIITKSEKISESLNNLLKNWEMRICTLDDLDHIASLMAGQRLAIEKNKKTAKPLEVNIDQLECALKLASEMNYSTLVPSKDLITPNSEILNEETGNNSDINRSKTSVSLC